MPRVWYGVPSARPMREAQRCFDEWRDMGYAVAATRKEPDLQLDLVLCLPKYPGLWAATNALAKAVLAGDPECEVFVTGGDDVWPDATKRADELVDEFVAHFGGTLGVMQATGPKGHERCAWAPWLGREWIERAFMGRGATEPEFWHTYGDAYLYEVAVRLGLMWERGDLKIEHRNWKELKIPRPPHLFKARDMRAHDKALFDRLIAEGFPGSDLLPAELAA